MYEVEEFWVEPKVGSFHSDISISIVSVILWLFEDKLELKLKLNEFIIEFNFLSFYVFFVFLCLVLGSFNLV